MATLTIKRYFYSGMTEKKGNLGMLYRSLTRCGAQPLRGNGCWLTWYKGGGGNAFDIANNS